MKKIRCYLAAIALLATLSGLPLQAMGSMANVTSRQPASVSSVLSAAGKSMKQEAFRPYGPCPVPGVNDC